MGAQTIQLVGRSWMTDAKLKLIKGNQLDILLETEELIKNGGPTLADDELIKYVADVIHNSDEKLKLEFYNVLKPILTLDTLLGFTFLKPHGYAGDFQLVNLIHTNHITDIEHLRAWDVMYQQLAASVALRNRKAYLNKFLDEEYEAKGYLRVLNLGSGPCRDIREFMDERPNIKIDIDCVDSDISAIAYAKDLCGRYSDNVHFQHKNALRYRTDIEYDVVWSAGMFDYFNDKIFKALTKRFYNFLKPGGVLALGNINTTNPHRIAMEVFGQWYLHHRSENDLKMLISESDIPSNCVSFNTEPTTVNIFAHVRK